ncbi:MAG: helicase-related protein, partial [Microcystaceae cyanobacterium]
ATVYRISQEFLSPAITHQTPVKERHEILTRFREGDYKILVASHVLNEGVDVPDARVAIIISGTGSVREYVQRLGRILRKGKQQHKLALLYEVVAEDTTEERTSERRKGSPDKRQAKSDQAVEKPKLKHQQLELIPSSYEEDAANFPRASESSVPWNIEKL